MNDYFEIERRRYSQAHSGRRLTPVVKWLLIVTFVIFVLQILIDKIELGWCNAIFGLNLYRFAPHGLYPWQFLTYMFLHAGIIHILFNMIGLYFFGCEIERYLGTVKFILFYLSAGIFSALCIWLTSPVFGPSITIGASGALFAVFIAFTVLFPDTMVMLLIPPIPIKARYLAWGFIAINFLYLLQGGSGFSAIAHLGGILYGYLYIRYQDFINRFYAFITRRWDRNVKKGFTGREHGMTDEVYLREEVDPILDKISEHGMESLTRRERRILKKARKRMEKRRGVNKKE